jgi:hypothetical protein
MAKCLIIMNHKATAEQLQGLKDQFGITETLTMPEELRPLWAQIPAKGEVFPEEHITPVIRWIGKNAVVGDHVWFQGEAAACILLRNYCLGRGLTAIYATSKREVEELRIGDSITKKSVFRHVTFRYYP